METATLSIIDQIPQSFIDLHKIEQGEAYLHMKTALIRYESITRIQSDNEKVTIHAGDTMICLYADGTNGILIT